MKQIINITDIIEYLYCPRKVYLRLVKGIRTPPNQKMILGMLRHKVLDLFNRNEKSLVSSIKRKAGDSEIKNLYENLSSNITNRAIEDNKSLIFKFRINLDELESSIKKTLEPEINLRVESIKKNLEQGFLGFELWQNLKPKYLSEFKIESPELGLRGRIDRIKLDDNITPIEVKTREKIFESDKLQLAGYALLLEKEFNKKIEKGIIEILGKHEEIALDENLKSQVLEIAEKIRALSEENAFFPSSFSKCEKCGLKEDCGK